MIYKNVLLRNTSMNITRSLIVCAAITLSACNRTDSTDTAGKKLDRVVASTEKATAKAEASAKASIDAAEAKVRETGANVKEAAKSASANMGKSVADAAIVTSVSADLVKDPDLSALKIDVDASDGVVRLYGPAPTEASRARASAIARSVKGVVKVENLLVVKQP